MRNRLLQGTALGATLVAGLVFGALPASAVNDCGVAAPMTTVTCTVPVMGQSFVDADGITYAVNDLTIVLSAGVTAEHIMSGNNANFGNLAITNNGIINQTAVSAGKAQAGLFLRTNNGTMTVMNSGDIMTLSDNVEGIFAYSTSGSSAVSVTTSGDITTQGANAHGVRAQSGSGPVTIMSSSDIMMSGKNATGLWGQSSNGDVMIVSTGDIVGTNGQRGVYGRSVTGNITMDVQGDVTLSGLGAGGAGVSAVNQNGKAIVTVSGTINVTNGAAGVLVGSAIAPASGTLTGSIVTSGVDNEGISVQSKGTVELIIDGSITTNGDGSFGARAQNLANVNAVNASVSATSIISTQGVNSDALRLQGGKIVADLAGTFMTTGSKAEGIYAYANTGGTANITFTGDVSTLGDEAEGIFSSASNGLVFNWTDGAVMTKGTMTASGVQLVSAQSNIEAAFVGGSISTLGGYSRGLQLSAVNSPLLTKLSSTTTITTAGEDSHGVSTTTGEGGILAEIGGSIATQGKEATGIRIEGLFVEIPNFPFPPDGAVTLVADGTVDTEGMGSHGVEIVTVFGAISATLEGEITTAGEAAAGLDAQSAKGAIGVSLIGSIDTKGMGATGIDAQADLGAVTVSTGAASKIGTQGDMAAGLVAGSGADSVTIMASGMIDTAGLAAQGIRGTTTTGPLAVTMTGTLSTGGNDAIGIDAESATGSVAVMLGGSLTTAGGGALGIDALSAAAVMATVTETGKITTEGATAVGLRAVSSGDAVTVVMSGDIDTGGAMAHGVVGDTAAGALAIGLAGSVDTKGAGARAVDAVSDSGSVMVMAGSTAALSTLGEMAVGLNAESGGAAGVTVAVAGSVETGGMAAHGIAGKTAAGALAVTLTGSVETGGAAAHAIVAESAAGTVEVMLGGSLATAGGGALGLEARSAAAVMAAVTAVGTIATEGAQAIGLRAASTGAGVTVAMAGGIETAGMGAHGIVGTTAAGALAITMTGSVETTGAGANGIEAVSTTGMVTVATGSSVSAGGTAIHLESGGGMSLTHGAGGSLLSGVDLVIDADGAGSFTGMNAGSMSGVVDLTAQGDTLTNLGSGVWGLRDRAGMTATADFGGGSDLFSNSGRLELLDWLAGSEAGVLANLETFRNSGIVDLSDAEAGDRLTTGGSYEALGGLLQIDTVLEGDGSPTDLLTIAGNATLVSGTTLLQVNNLGGNGDRTTDGILVIEVGGTSDAGTFALPGGMLDVGSFRYLLEERNEDWFLVGDLLPGLAFSAEAPHVALASWHSGVRALDERMGELRSILLATNGGGQTATLGATDAQEAYLPSATANPVGLWARMNYDRLDQDPDGGSAFDQTIFVGQVGADLGFRELLTGGDILVLGAMAGIVSSEADDNDSDASQSLDGWSAGLYASYLWGGLHLDLVGKLDGYEIEHKAPGIGFEETQDALVYGFSFDAGYRIGLGERLFLEPQGQIAYAHADLDDVAMPGGETAEYDDASSLRLRAGARAGASLMLGGATLLPYLEASYVHEFLGESNATLATVDFASSLEGGGVELGGGLAVADLGDHFSLNLDADYLIGERTQGLQVTFGGRVTW